MGGGARRRAAREPPIVTGAHLDRPRRPLRRTHRVRWVCYPVPNRMESKLRAPPVVIVHSDAHDDEPWLRRFTTQLRALRVPFWAGAQPGEDLKERFKEVLDGAVVVVL